MTNEFDPKLKAQLVARKRERRLERARIAGKKKLRDYLAERGLSDVSQDPTLTRVVPARPVPERHDDDDERAIRESRF